jgi:tRNA pseudouridine38-40 synthase
MARYFLTLSYNGSKFNGWQVQENTPDTVQQILEDKLSMILKEKIALTGCGRTDTGVHARDFVAHFDSRDENLQENAKHWLYKFNTVLPPSIAVQGIRRVHNNAHARFDATQRVYHYYISQRKNPFRDQFTWYVYGELDLDLMNEAAVKLLQHKDFTSFSKHHTQNKTNICHISKAMWHKSGEHEYRFTISSDRFLRGMVRAIVGTLVLVGRNKLSLAGFEEIIRERDRAKAGGNAPANALFLAGIKYPERVHI